jgi:hypothetical protein
MPVQTDARDRATLTDIHFSPLEWIIVAILLLLRFPFLILGEFIPIGLSVPAQMTIYTDLTYGLTGAFFILQRRSLRAFFAVVAAASQWDPGSDCQRRAQ